MPAMDDPTRAGRLVHLTMTGEVDDVADELWRTLGADPDEVSIVVAWLFDLADALAALA